MHLLARCVPRPIRLNTDGFWHWISLRKHCAILLTSSGDKTVRMSYLMLRSSAAGNSASSRAIKTMVNKRSLAEAASELRRELGIRRRCYGRWIQDGKLDEVEATDRIERMELALDVVERSALLATVVPDTVEAILSDAIGIPPVTSSGDKTQHSTV